MWDRIRGRDCNKGPCGDGKAVPSRDSRNSKPLRHPWLLPESRLRTSDTHGRLMDEVSENGLTRAKKVDQRTYLLLNGAVALMKFGVNEDYVPTLNRLESLRSRGYSTTLDNCPGSGFFKCRYPKGDQPIRGILMKGGVDWDTTKPLRHQRESWSSVTPKTVKDLKEIISKICQDKDPQNSALKFFLDKDGSLLIRDCEFAQGRDPKTLEKMTRALRVFQIIAASRNAINWLKNSHSSH